MATGEVVDEESLGGAEMHSKISGLSDYLAEDELDGLRIAREIAAHLEPKPPPPRAKTEEPLYPADELLGVVSSDIRVPFDVKEVIARIVDGSKFEEFKVKYGSTLVTGWARVRFSGRDSGQQRRADFRIRRKGRAVHSPLQPAEHSLVVPAEHHRLYGRAQLRRAGNHPQRRETDQRGLEFDGTAVTLMIGGSYGAGNYAMCGRAYDPRFVFTWPNHRIAVMGGQQLAGVMDIIKRDAAARAGVEIDEAKQAAAKKALEDQIEKESDVYFATARLWDDGIIDPRETRTVWRSRLRRRIRGRSKGQWRGAYFAISTTLTKLDDGTVPISRGLI